MRFADKLWCRRVRSDSSEEERDEASAAPPAVL